MEKNINVLLVEDNPADTRFMQEIFLETPFRGLPLVCVDRLQKGIERVRQGGIDVVLLDLTLPDSQGLSTFTALHNREPDLPIIVLTGQDDHDLSVRAVSAGAQDYLVKGTFNSDSLLRIIRYALERARILRVLIEKEKQLQQSEKLAVLGTMLSGVAHNFNNPLFVISGMLQLFKSKGGLSENQVKTIEKIEGQVARISKIVRDLSDLAYRKVMEKAEINVNPIIVETVESAKSHFQDKQILMDLDLDPDDRITGNTSEIEQIVFQLLANAVEAIDTKGLITVRTGNDGRRMRITISDTGRGMDKDLQARILNPFFTTKEGVAAVGLGLSVVHRIVERNKGRIEFQSEPGKGTDVTVSLPLF